jgi:type I restriction enzyme S subunit
VSFDLVKIKDICSFIRGLTYSKSDEVEFSSNAVLRANNIDLETSQLNLDDIRYINDSVKISIEKKVKVNDILICTASGSKSHLGKVALIEKHHDMAFGGFMGVLRCKENILPKYLFCFLKSDFFGSHIRGLSDGANINNLKFSQIENIEIPLPSLATQKKIVEKLDAIFAEIDKALWASEANVKNAEALYQNYLTYVFQIRGENWSEISLQDLLDKGWIVSHLDGNHGGDYPRKEEFISSGVPYISANCLDGDFIDLSKSKFLSVERTSKLRKGFAKNNDVLFAHNATVGPVAILKTHEEVTILGTSLTYYRCNQEFIEPEYLVSYMRSTKFKNQYLSIMRQSTRNQIPITKQREFFHLIPPIVEQRVLLKKFNALWNLKNSYETQSLKRIKAMSTLKISVLKQAFNGELVKD